MNLEQLTKMCLERLPIQPPLETVLTGENRWFEIYWGIKLTPNRHATGAIRVVGNGLLETLPEVLKQLEAKAAKDKFDIDEVHINQVQYQWSDMDFDDFDEDNEDNEE